jgi:hypothetical protein
VQGNQPRLPSSPVTAARSSSRPTKLVTGTGSVGVRFTTSPRVSGALAV